MVIFIAIIIIVGIVLLPNIDKLKELFGGSSFGEPGEQGSGTGLPIMQGEQLSGENEIFFDGDNTDLFSSINDRDSYKREFRVINSYNSVQTTNNFTMLKSGDNYAVDSSSQKMIYTEGKLYIESELYTLITDATVSEIYEDIGITTLETVIEIANSENAQVSVANDGKMIIVYYSGSDYSSHSEYEISVETGIVTYEAHYVSGQLTRCVVTDSVDVLIGEEISTEYFDIPTLQ
ncbi:MAG: hypothetical protein E7628_00795 [Ruminococcaceae bacterium]|nr:hypothetical protein [Oscillospiraceae bacterium]